MIKKAAGAEDFLPHEDFEIKPTTKAKEVSRFRIVREERFTVDSGNVFVFFGKTQIPVVNYSAFGFAIEAPISFEAPIEAADVIFVVDNVEIAQMRVQKSREEVEDDTRRVGYEIISEPLSCETVMASLEVKALLNSHDTVFSKYTNLSALFKESIYDICFRLVDIERKLNGLEATKNLNANQDQNLFEASATQIVAEHINRVFTPLLEKAKEFYCDFDEETMKMAHSFFRDCLHDQIYQSPFSHRSMSKPLGYAGDFEMMNILYRNEIVGKSLFAKSMHRFYMEHPNAKAIRNRCVYLNEKIKETATDVTKRKAHILSVACGPAREVQNILSDESLDFIDHLEFTLLDQDEKALQLAKSEVRNISRKRQITPAVTFVNLAIKNIIKKGLTETYDLIYSAGLFDYFSDPVAEVAGRQLYNALKPGGRLIIGNFHSSTDIRTLMDFALDWLLIYRSAPDLKRLYGGFGGEVAVESESEGINLFVVIRKPRD